MEKSKTVVGAGQGRKIRYSGLGVLTLRRLSDIQVETAGSNWVYNWKEVWAGDITFRDIRTRSFGTG